MRQSFEAAKTLPRNRRTLFKETSDTDELID
jgi:hypothetical protein